ncbi:MAG: DUF192 domain-containing protein [Candidatus Aenigmarchaeota archaeon]|nr:DUF192 domain-containing protein [Candidatus Aenigmarchaeota archaeon]
MTRHLIFILLVAILAIGVTQFGSHQGEEGIRASLLGAVHAAQSEIRVFIDWRAGIPLTIKGVTIIARVAETEEEQGEGLGGIWRLSDDKGMLYVYPRPDFYTHNMKDMRFPLDIIWIGKNKTIVDVIENVQPDSYPDYAFVNDFLAQYVLEISAGFFEKHKLKLGDLVEFSLEGLERSVVQ